MKHTSDYDSSRTMKTSQRQLSSTKMCKTFLDKSISVNQTDDSENQHLTTVNFKVTPRSKV